MILFILVVLLLLLLLLLTQSLFVAIVGDDTLPECIEYTDGLNIL